MEFKQEAQHLNQFSHTTILNVSSDSELLLPYVYRTEPGYMSLRDQSQLEYQFFMEADLSSRLLYILSCPS